MKKLFAKLLIYCCLPLLWAASALAQKDGIQSFGAADAHQYDTVDLTTLVNSFNFPLVSKSVGAIPGSLSLESPQFCSYIPTGNTSTQFWSCGANTLASLYPITVNVVNMSLAYTSRVAGNCNVYTVTALTGIDGLSTYPVTPVSVEYPISGSCSPTTGTVNTNDGTGLTGSITANNGGPGLTKVVTASGASAVYSTVNQHATTTITDPFGNVLTYSGAGSTMVDTLGATTTFGGGPPGLPTSYQYTDSNGATQNITFTLGTQTTLQTNGGPCAQNGSNVTPISSINYPDGTSIGLTWQTNGSGLSGLISAIQLRTGGSISYSYSSPVNGACATPPIPWYYTSLSRTDVDGTTQYSATYNGGTCQCVTTTTVLDPGKNKTVYVFLDTGGFIGRPTFLQSVTRYQNTGSVMTPSYTEISSTSYCYNTSCTATPSLPITQRDIYQYVYNTSNTQVEVSHDVQTYDSTYGLLVTDANTDEITSGTPTITKTLAYSSCGVTNANIHDHPCSITTTNGSNQLAKKSYTYNANGALLTSADWVSSTDTLTTNYTPTTQGVYSAIQDPNGQTANYTYGSCNSLMPTDITTTVNGIAIDNKKTWNCNAGVVTDTTDANSNEDDTAYDSMNRIHTHFDRLGDSNTTTYTYGTPTLDHVEIQDPMGVQRYTYNDGLGRSTVSQTRQSSSSSNYDTVSKAYGWKDSMSNALTNFQTTTSVACSQTLGNSCTSVAVTALTNPVAGPQSSKDINLGTTSNSLDANDSSVTVGPAPTGENTKTVQTEKNGFGQITSVCGVETSGGSSCGQLLGNSGILTSTAYTYGSGTSTITTTRGSQTHTTIKDALGRVTSFQTPEAGTVTNKYETFPTAYCHNNPNNPYTSNGDLVATADAAGNHLCFYYDGLHRLTDVDNNNNSAVNACKRFRFDSVSAAQVQNAPSGYPSSGNNIIGRMFEAETDNCVSGNQFPFLTAITDEWFAYDNNGRMTDMWEKTPNSGSTYYHTTVAYDADGVVTSISGVPGYTNTFTFTTDGEDRPNASKFGTTTIVSATAGSGFQYDNASRPLFVPWGTLGDQDAYTYDGLEHMTGYTLTVNGVSDAGALTWNKDGSLQKLVITDGFNSGGSQTCKYLYDDVGRLGVPPNSPTPPNSMGTKSVDCGTNFNGEYGWDQYNNLTQAGTLSWAPGYSSSNNQQTGSTYDSNGRTQYDTINTYTWDIHGKMASVIAGNHTTTCGTSGTCITYDAAGRAVEFNNAGTTSQILYGPTGRLGVMNGQTAVHILVPQPGGGSVVFNGSDGNSNRLVMHTDWLGTVRLATILGGTRATSFDTAYAPFSQTYDTFGSLTQDNTVFTGDKQDIFEGLFDTPNRELLQNSGRWLTPEFSGSFNGYNYVTDPNTQTDPSGAIPSLGYTSLWFLTVPTSNGESACSAYCKAHTLVYDPLDMGGPNTPPPASTWWLDNSGQCGALCGGAGGYDPTRIRLGINIPGKYPWQDDPYWDPEGIKEMKINDMDVMNRMSPQELLDLQREINMRQFGGRVVDPIGPEDVTNVVGGSILIALAYKDALRSADFGPNFDYFSFTGDEFFTSRPPEPYTQGWSFKQGLDAIYNFFFYYPEKGGSKPDFPSIP